MSLGGFSPEELEALSSFREILAPFSLPSEILVDTFLIRWLRARGLRLPEAKAMLLESLRWRKEFKMDKILDEEFPLPLVQSQPVAYCGLDKDGFATFIVPVGRHDVKGCLERYEAAEVERMQIQAMERVLQQVERDMVDEGFSHQVPQVIEILDFEGFTYGQFFSTACMQYSMKLVPKLEANYPELICLILVINAPRFFNLIFRLLKPLINKATLRKIHVFGIGEDEKWKEVVRKRFPVEKIPLRWGGNLKGCDEYCTDSGIWTGAPKQRELKLLLDGAIQLN